MRVAGIHVQRMTTSPSHLRESNSLCKIVDEGCCNDCFNDKFCYLTPTPSPKAFTLNPPWKRTPQMCSSFHQDMSFAPLIPDDLDDEVKGTEENGCVPCLPRFSVSTQQLLPMKNLSLNKSSLYAIATSKEEEDIVASLILSLSQIQLGESFSSKPCLPQGPLPCLGGTTKHVRETSLGAGAA